MNINRKLKVIGVIGDVHTENELLEKAIEFLRLQKVETILCEGFVQFYQFSRGSDLKSQKECYKSYIPLNPP